MLPNEGYNPVCTDAKRVAPQREAVTAAGVGAGAPPGACADRAPEM
jgi:hypothetical protein